MSSNKRARLDAAKDSEDDDTLLRDLQDLLRPLSSEPISLAILADHAAIGDPDNESSILCRDQVRREQHQLFETHIGPYDEVLDGVSRHVDMEYGDYMYWLRDRGPQSDRYKDPEITVAQGPRLDMHVLMGLFLGKDAEEESRKQYEEGQTEECYGDVRDAFRRHGAVRKLSILETARNILQYLADASKTMDLERLLYVCAVYGLSRSAQHVLDGRYGAIGTLTIDTPLLVPKNETSYCRDSLPFCARLPFIGVAAILGHDSAVRFAVESLRADIHALPAYLDGKDNLKPNDYRGDVGVFALYWCIHKNQTGMVKTLADVGVRFHWLINDRLKRIFHLLFHVHHEHDESGPVWLPQGYRCDDDDFDDRREMRRSRAKRCYEEKLTMLSAVIDAGMPKDLLVPSNVDFAAVHNKAVRLAKVEGLDEPSDEVWGQINAQTTKAEEETIGIMNKACTEYNSVRKHEEWFSVFEFAQYVNNLFLDRDGKPRPNVQKRCLEDFEALDPRWKQRKDEDRDNCVYWWMEEDDDV